MNSVSTPASGGSRGGGHPPTAHTLLPTNLGELLRRWGVGMIKAKVGKVVIKKLAKV